MSNTNNIFVEKDSNIDTETISMTNGSLVYIPNVTYNKINVYSSVPGGSIFINQQWKHWEEHHKYLQEEKFYNKVKKLLEE